MKLHLFPLLATALLMSPAYAGKWYFGADLSYVNEMEDCGAQYREQGKPKEAFQLFREHGANLVRVRLWHTPDWTRYSNLADVEKTIRRSKAAGLETLLDFHYSDDWADGEKQIIPKAWASDLHNVDKLAERLYQYTYDTLIQLDRQDLMPELVQVGNETNTEIMGEANWGKTRSINWQRNAKLFNAGIRAVRDAGAKSAIKPRVMLHIAQPENAEPWFAAARQAGVTDFDLIGLSYYRKWSSKSMPELGNTIANLHKTYNTDVLLVETAYPWTLGWVKGDTHGNLLGEDSLIEGYPATPDGQRRYLIDLTQLVISNGGAGTVYWEPAWVSTQCETRWGRGSAWENATFFDFNRNNEVLPGIDFMKHPYVAPAETAAPAR